LDELASSELEAERKVGVGTKLKRFFQRFELKAEAPQSLLTAGLWQIIGTVIASIMSWLLVVVISREDIGLGPSGTGILNTAVAVFTIFSLLTSGIGKSTSQMVSENFSDKPLAFKNARNGTFAAILVGIILGIVLIICSFIIGMPLAFRPEMSLSTIVFVIGVVMVITGMRDGFIGNFAAAGEYDEIAKSNAINALFQLAGAITFVVLIKNSILPNASIIFILVIGMAAQTLFLTRYFNQFWLNTQLFRFTQVDRRFFGNIRQGFYFAITDIIPTGLLGSISLILLLFFTHNNYDVVGAYSIILGYSLGGLMVTGFAWPLITSVAEAYGRKDSEKIGYYLRLIVKIFFYVTFLILTIDICLSYGIIGVFHGSVYLTGPTDVWWSFIIVIVAYAIAAFEYVLSSILLGIRKGRSAAFYLGSMFLVTIGITSLCLWFNLFPLPQLSAAVGFLISTLIMLPIIPFLLKKHVQQRIPFMIGIRSILALVCTIAIGAVLMWPPLKLIPLSNGFLILIMGFVMIVIYLLLLIFFGAISQEDFQLLERKAEEYGLKKTIEPVLNLLRKIMRSSPFCEHDKCLE
jgi:O-antigen/teichoic acid export membrane protein